MILGRLYLLIDDFILSMSEDIIFSSDTQYMTVWCWDYIWFWFSVCLEILFLSEGFSAPNSWEDNY